MLFLFVLQQREHGTSRKYYSWKIANENNCIGQIANDSRRNSSFQDLIKFNTHNFFSLYACKRLYKSF